MLRRLPELGVDFVDTADSYGPDVCELIIREALHPYPGMVIATKGGLTRTRPESLAPLGRPEYLVQQAHEEPARSRRRAIDLWQLHRIDPKVPREEQFGAIGSLIDDKVIRFAGLSEVSVEDIEAASKVFPVATVQNRYNLADRERGRARLLRGQGHRLHPVVPARRRRPCQTGLAARRDRARPGATPGQVALAWLLKRSPVMLPIPGTSKVAHLEENVAAAGLTLSDAEFAALDRAARAA